MQSAIVRPLAAVDPDKARRPSSWPPASLTRCLRVGIGRGGWSAVSRRRTADGKAGRGGSSHVGRQSYVFLKHKSAVATESENYEEAAEIRDMLRKLEDGEPVLRLKRLLKQAAAEESFEDAARYRDELKLVAQHSLLKCSSHATTLGIRVQEKSVYIESRSHPSRVQYFFAYRIRITNNSDRPVQLAANGIMEAC